MLQQVAEQLPEQAETMLVDTRLTDEQYASARVFRVYQPVPAHYHRTCDEYLLVISGSGEFFLGDAPSFVVEPGKLVFFRQGEVHGINKILEEPLVFLAIDTPRRDPADITFVDTGAGTATTFIATL